MMRLGSVFLQTGRLARSGTNGLHTMVSMNRLKLNASHAWIPSINGQKRCISDKLKSELENVVKKHRVVVFMKGNKESPQCGFSRAVVQILQLQGVEDFKTVNVLADEDVRNGIKEYTSWPTIPQVFIDGEFVGGCDILLNMHQSGELEKVLKKD